MIWHEQKQLQIPPLLLMVDSRRFEQDELGFVVAKLIQATRLCANSNEISGAESSRKVLCMA
jgi:hypothetical protein